MRLSSLRNSVPHTITHTDMCIMDITEEEKTKQKIFEETTTEKFPNLMINSLHIKEAQWTTRRIDSKRFYSWYTIIKWSKDKERFLKISIKNEASHQNILNKIIHSHLIRNHQSQDSVRWHSQNVERKTQSIKYLYLTKVFFKTKGEIKLFLHERERERDMQR